MCFRLFDLLCKFLRVLLVLVFSRLVGCLFIAYRFVGGWVVMLFARACGLLYCVGFGLYFIIVLR